MLTFTTKMAYSNIWDKRNAPVEPETAALDPGEVPVEPRAAGVEHVAAPEDKGSSPSEAPEALSFSRSLAFSPSGATTY